MSTPSAPVSPAQQIALNSELAAALAAPQAAPAPKPALHAASGKTLPASPAETGKTLPLVTLSPLPLVAAPPVAPVEAPVSDTEGAKDEPPVFVDLALLQSSPTPALAIVPSEAPRPQLAPVQHQPAAIALSVPQFAAPVRPAKAQEAQPVVAAPDQPTEPAGAPTAPAILASIPLARIQNLRQPRAAETPLPLAPAASAAPFMAEPPATPAEPAAITLPPATPEIELAPVIERLVETRLQSRERVSEVNVPHPDFGRVTLALSLAGADQLSIAMPDAPPELRSAVGQAFASPPTESTSTTSDARGGEARRDPQTSGERRDQPRGNTHPNSNPQFTTNRDNRREENGRGVLA